MSEQATAYPLYWPSGWKRTPAKDRRRADFRTGGRALTIGDGVNRVLAELERHGAQEQTIIISTNVRPQLGRSADTSPEDTGVAVYWPRKGSQSCMAIDCYNRVADNLAGVAITLQYMRGIERHGGAEILERVFLGFQALPEPDGQWWKVLGFDLAPKTLQEAVDAYKSLAKTHHPDHGGDAGKFASITRAIERARGILQ